MNRAAAKAEPRKMAPNDVRQTVNAPA